MTSSKCTTTVKGISLILFHIEKVAYLEDGSTKRENKVLTLLWCQKLQTSEWQSIPQKLTTA